MPTKNVVASFVLGLLFVSLVILYLSIPQNNLVTFLSILILLVSLLVGLTGGWREIGVMGTFAGLVSIVAAHFVGLAWFGALGGWLVPILWVLILVGMFNWISNSMLRVPKDRAVLIVRPYSGFMYQAASPVAPPIMPYFERKVGEIPLYELSEDVPIEKVNTKRFNVDRIDV